MQDSSQVQAHHCFVNGNDYLELPAHPQPWIIKNLIPSGGAVNIYGKAKTGKSFLSLGAALAIANPTRETFLGFPVEMHGKVAYFQVDTPRNSWQDRIKAIRKLEPDITAEVLDNLYISDKTNTPLPFNILNPAHAGWLQKQLDLVCPVVVFIDVLREVHRCNENDSQEMQAAISTLLATTSPYATVLVSHSRKENQFQLDDDIMSDGRGSNYVAGRMDVVGKLTDKQFKFQGRDVERTIISVKQRPEDGMVVLSDVEQDEAKQDLILIMFLKNFIGKEFSRNKVASFLSKDLQITVSAANKRIIRLPNSKSWTPELATLFKDEKWF